MCAKKFIKEVTYHLCYCLLEISCKSGTLNLSIYKCLTIKNSYGGKYLSACIPLLKLLLAKHLWPKEGREGKIIT